MTKFKMTDESIKRLTSLGTQSKMLASMAKTVFIVGDDTLGINLYSNQNMMSFAVDIELETHEDDIELDYFSLDLVDFYSTVSKISQGDAVDVLIDRENNKVTIQNAVQERPSKITLATFNTVVTQEEAEEARDAIETNIAEYFADDNEKVLPCNISAEVISFFDMAQKFMNVTQMANAVALEKNVVKYGDRLALVEKTLEANIHESEEAVYLQKHVIEFIKPFIKQSGAISTRFDESRDRILITSSEFGFSAIMALSQVQFAYPTAEDLAQFGPVEDYEKRVTVNKAELLKAFDMFNGTFKTDNWKLSTISLVVDSNHENEILLEHSDYNAECFTTVNAEPVNVTDTNTDFSFLFSSSCVSDLLNIVSEENFELVFNSLELHEANGRGFLIETPTVKALCCKILDSN